MPHIIVDASSVHYRVSKRAAESAPAAVCVHGSGADSVVWAYQVSRLSSRFRIIAPDLPGHGRSEGNALGSAEAYALWLYRFARELELGPFFLMGHSFGGAIVQEYARRYAHKLKGIVLAATGTKFKLSRAYRELHESGANVQNLEVAAIPDDIRQGYDLLKRVSGPLLHADLLAAGAFDSSGWISSLAVPALVLWGSSDFITERELPESLYRQMSNASFHVIEGAAHVLMVDAPNAFNAAVSEFMERYAGACG